MAVEIFMFCSEGSLDINNRTEKYFFSKNNCFTVFLSYLTHKSKIFYIKSYEALCNERSKFREYHFQVSKSEKNKIIFFKSKKINKNYCY